MPDGVVSPRDFTQVMEDGGMNLAVTQGNTVIFDSFSPEEVVRQRNLKNNNVSKLNQISNRFANEFNIRISSVSITAVLCAETVADYKIIDKRAKKELTASDKRPEYMKIYQEGGGGNNNNNPSVKYTDHQSNDNDDTGTTTTTTANKKKRQRAAGSSSSSSEHPSAAMQASPAIMTMMQPTPSPPQLHPVSAMSSLPLPASMGRMLMAASNDNSSSSSPPFQHPYHHYYHYHQQQQQRSFVNSSAFDHPGVPGFMAGPSYRQEINTDVVQGLCHLSYKVAHNQQVRDYMHFTSSSPPQLTNPRQLKQGDVVVVEEEGGAANDSSSGNNDTDCSSGREDDEDRSRSGDSPAKPFPFKSKDPSAEIPDPIFDESTLLASQMSDNIRAVVSVKDLFRPSPPVATITADEMQKCNAAVVLQRLSSDLIPAATASSSTSTAAQ